MLVVCMHFKYIPQVAKPGLSTEFGRGILAVNSLGNSD